MRRIAVIKCWETRFAFSPIPFLEGIHAGQYNWADLRRLVRRGREISADAVIAGIRKEYAFLGAVTEEEAALAGDVYQREQRTCWSLANNLKTIF